MESLSTFDLRCFMESQVQGDFSVIFKSGFRLTFYVRKSFDLFRAYPTHYFHYGLSEQLKGTERDPAQWVWRDWRNPIETNLEKRRRQNLEELLRRREA
jgi:hypothetical protein